MIIFIVGLMEQILSIYNSVQLMDSQRMRMGYLVELMEIVCSNAGYSRFIDEKMLVEWRTYFDICQLIFSQLSIKIIKIQENPSAPPAQKLHQLIVLLSQELEVEELREIDARQVLSFNTDHIHRLLEILYLYSKIYMESKKPTTVVKSETEEKQKDKPAFSSARDNRKSQQQADYEEEYHQQQQSYHQPSESTHRQEQYSSQPYPQQAKPNYPKPQQYLIPDRRKKKKAKPTYSANAKLARSQSALRKNLHEAIVTTIVDTKSGLISAATRDNRKSRLEGIKMAKDEYRTYLKRYAKQNHATSKRNSHLKAKAKSKPISQELPLKDFEAIDNFFQSFAYKFRDKKATYLQRIQKLVHQQELDRYIHQSRLERELKQAMNSHLQEQINSRTHQHRVRSAILREQSTALDQNIVSMAKEAKRRNSIHKRQLKQAKRQELKVIENALRQENQKVLNSLQQGGRLQQIIMQMYKRF